MVMRGFAGAITAGVYVKYLHLHGLDVFGVNLVNMLFYLCLILFDVPTGAFADVFGRKKSIMVSGVCYALSCTTYGLSETVLGFCTAEILAALGMTFNNGALKSWLVDRLAHHKVEVDRTALFAKMSIIAKLSSMPAAAIGSWLMIKNISLPWFVEATIFGSTSVVAYFFMHEEYFEKKKVSLVGSYHLMLESIRSSFHYVKNNKVVRFIVLSSMVQIFAVQAPNMQWIPKFESSIGGMAYLGTAYAVFSLAMMVGSYLSKKLVKQGVNEASLINGIQISIGVLLVISAVLPPPWSLVIFVIHQIPRGMYEPVKDAYLNDHIPGKVRATLSSFESVFPNLGGMIGLLTTGAMGEYVGIPFAWVVSGLTLVTIAIIFGRGMK